MEDSLQNDPNWVQYRRLKPTIDQRYPPGRFVAIDEGAIVADSDDFLELHEALKKRGKDSRDILVVQAGVEYPEYGIIL
jgi:hypothetical protein